MSVQCIGWLQWDHICLWPDWHRKDLHHYWRSWALQWPWHYSPHSFLPIWVHWEGTYTYFEILLFWLKKKKSPCFWYLGYWCRCWWDQWWNAIIVHNMVLDRVSATDAGPCLKKGLLQPHHPGPDDPKTPKVQL